jgi:hypothetical protein
MKTLMFSLLLQYLKFPVSVCARGPFPRDTAAQVLSKTVYTEKYTASWDNCTDFSLQKYH